jgi:hypothetical protein
MRCKEPTKLHRKSGMWGTPGFLVRTDHPGFLVGQMLLRGGTSDYLDEVVEP